MIDPSQQKPPLATSMLYMWRSLLALAWADGSCGQEEIDYFAKVFSNLSRYFDLTQEQRDTLADDLVNAKKIDGLFNHINDPEARGNLLVFARDLAVLDGELSPEEDSILKRLHLWHEPGYDTEALRVEIQGIIAKGRQDRADELGKLRADAHKRKLPFFVAFDRLMLRLGIDVLD